VKNNSLIRGLFGSLTKLSFDDNAGSGKDTEVSKTETQTGVAKYLSEKSAITSVEKYLKKHPHDPATGVSKYVAKRILSNKPSVTRVSKYITKHSVLQKEKSGISSVERYVVKQALKPKVVLTGVAIYLRNKDKQEQERLPKTTVAKFLWQKEIALKKQVAQALIKKYVEAEKEAAKLAAENPQPEENHSEEEVFDPASTGVAKYLAKKTTERKHLATGVSKYVAKKRTQENSSPALTGVEKYLLKMAVAPKPALTRVDKYVVKKGLQASASPVTTRVEKYLARKEVLQNGQSKISSVQKYLLKLSILKPKSISEKTTNHESINNPVDEHVESVSQVTGVEKYLQQKAEQQPQEAKLSKVEQYLAQKALKESNKEKILTGVERYLRKNSA
jgi:hypothetical protein